MKESEIKDKYNDFAWGITNQGNTNEADISIVFAYILQRSPKAWKTDCGNWIIEEESLDHVSSWCNG